jgi:hypothetical protein
MGLRAASNCPKAHRPGAASGGCQPLWLRDHGCDGHVSAPHVARRSGELFQIDTDVLLYDVTMNIRGNSYRLKDKLKAGLVRSHDDNSSQPGGEI